MIGPAEDPMDGVRRASHFVCCIVSFATLKDGSLLGEYERFGGEIVPEFVLTPL